MRYLFSILTVFFFLSCGTETTPTYTLTTSVVGEGSITPSGGEYEEGEVVTLTGTPNEGWIFLGWNGDFVSTSITDPLVITMDRNINVIGTFVRRNYPLTITIEGEGTVTERIVSSPKTTEYPYKTVVELTPIPTNGWEFVEWNNWDGEVDEENRIVITVDGETNITITFERIDYPLTITIEGEGEVEQEVVQPKTSEYPFETVVQLTPIPSDGWRFTEWGGDLSGDVKPIQITISEEKNVSVKFSPIVFLGENGITIMCPDGNIGDVGVVNGVEYEVVDRRLLIQRFEEGRGKFNREVCVSLITNMSRLFRGLRFNEPIGNWDVSNVTNMSGMFSGDLLEPSSPFNQPIGDWDVGNVTDMSNMFSGTPFNQPIGNWDISNVINMRFMFSNSQFNQPIGDWDVSNVTNMSGMFFGTPFNQPIGNWDVSSVTIMSQMFDITPFNQPIGNWDVGNVRNMLQMFSRSPFNQPIGDWDVSQVTEMSNMFTRSQFNQPIGEWDVSNVKNMRGIFGDSPFNQNISDWCVWRIETEPFQFSLNSPLTPQNKPKWGTCPD